MLNSGGNNYTVPTGKKALIKSIIASNWTGGLRSDLSTAIATIVVNSVNILNIRVCGGGWIKEDYIGDINYFTGASNVTISGTEPSYAAAVANPIISRTTTKYVISYESKVFNFRYPVILTAGQTITRTNCSILITGALENA